MKSHFSQSFDAVEWARAFVVLVKTDPTIATDEATMTGWFANAIMRGYDEYPHRHSAQLVSSPENNVAAV